MKKAPHVLLQDLAGEAVLLNLDNGFYYGLDEVSCRLYHLLVSSPSVDAAFEHALKEYNVEPDRLRQDLESFLGRLLENGLVIRDENELD